MHQHTIPLVGLVAGAVLFAACSDTNQPTAHPISPYPQLPQPASSSQTIPSP